MTLNQFKQFSFDFDGTTVTWEISESILNGVSKFIAKSVHPIFQKYFPDGTARIAQIFRLFDNRLKTGGDRRFFQLLIDSFDFEEDKT